MFEISSTVQQIESAFFYIFAVSVIFLLGITFCMVWFLIRFNHKRNPVPSKSHGNLPLEIAWTVIPTILALAMFYYGWLGFETVRNVPQGATQVTVEGRSFFWTFRYANDRVEKELRLPVGKPVRLALVSSDVNHSFYIPAYKIKEDLIPGRENYISFTPLRAGVYDIMCAEFCGTGHSTMLSRLIAMPAKEFDLWLAKPRAQQPIPIEQAIAGKVEQVERGSSVYDLNCQSCHGPEGRGTGVPRARNFTSLENWKNGPTIPEMFRTLYNGLGREMPSFQHLPMDDRFAAIHYIRTFNPNYPNAPEEAIHALDTEYNISRGQLPRPELPIAEAMLKIVQEAVGKRPFSGVEPSPATPIAKPSPVLGDEELARLKERDPLGADLYQANCASCHGGRGQGGRTVETLDEIWGARFRSLALTDPQGTWRKEDAEALRLRMEAISIATGGIKPEFNTFSQSDWQAVHDFILGLVPPVSLDLEMQ